LRLFSPFPVPASGEESPARQAAGHDSAAARTEASAALSFLEQFPAAGCAPRRKPFAAVSRVKEEEF
jgi:hypothetical protein